MSKQAKRLSNSKRKRQEAFQADVEARQQDIPEPRRKPHRTISALTEAQGHYLCAIESAKLTFGLGPAGVGKTYVAAARAAELLSDRRINQILVTRPMVTAGKGAGFLPGELADKFAPFFAPFKGVFDQVLGRSQTDAMMKGGRIEAKPIDYIRGLTFEDAFVILDEAQNTTPEQMKLFLTRIGENCTIVVNGDVTQKDIPGYCGLEDACKRLRGLKDVTIVEFTEDDIVRSGLIKDIMLRYRN